MPTINKIIKGVKQPKKVFWFLYNKIKTNFSSINSRLYHTKIRQKINFYICQYKINKKIKTNQPIKIMIGTENTKSKGWLKTDMEFLNLLSESDWQRLCKKENSISALLAEHVWEHLNNDEGLEATTRCYRYLKPGGYLRLAVPDGFHPDPHYIKKVNIQLENPTGHKVLFNYKILKELLEKVGFKQINFLEFFDPEYNFHQINWDSKDGHISRSLKNDARNKDGHPHYTSIIVDAFK